MACVVLLPLLLACASRTSANRIAELDVPAATVSGPTFEQQRILVRRFSEGRPDQHSRQLPGGGLVVGGYVREYASTYREKQGQQWASYQGWLPLELPYLLQRSLPGSNVVVADELPDGGQGQAWDYVIEGRLTKTRLTWRGAALWAVASIVGTPSQTIRYELAYELRVFRGTAPDHPVLTRTYTFDEGFVVGAYYNNRRMQQLPLLALRTTVHDSAQDLVAEVAKHQGRTVAEPQRFAEALTHELELDQRERRELGLD